MVFNHSLPPPSQDPLDVNTAWKVSVFGVFSVRIFPHLVRMQENTDQKNSEYRHFSRKEN